MRDTVENGSAPHTGLIRSKNEDFAIILQQGDGHPCALIIADGMGGHRRGELASRVAVDYVSSHLQPVLSSGSISEPEQWKEKLTTVFEKANVKVYLSSLADQENEGMGTTLTTAVLIPGQIIIAHVGDCRAYLLHDGELLRLTVDHTLVQELVDKGSISLDESIHHPRRNVLTRALGLPDYLQPDVTVHSLCEGDRLLLCSDGLHGMLSDEHISECLSQSLSAPDMAGAFIERAIALGGEDNITVLLAIE